MVQNFKTIGLGMLLVISQACSADEYMCALGYVSGLGMVTFSRHPSFKGPANYCKMIFVSSLAAAVTCDSTKDKKNWKITRSIAIGAASGAFVGASGVYAGKLGSEASYFIGNKVGLALFKSPKNILLARTAACSIGTISATICATAKAVSTAVPLSLDAISKLE